MILVTGATGQLGGAAAQQLLKHLEPNQLIRVFQVRQHRRNRLRKNDLR